MNEPATPLTGLAGATSSDSGREEMVDQVVNKIMDDFNRHGGLETILGLANSSSKIRSTLWLNVHAALTSPSSIGETQELRKALEECADKLWILRCNSRDAKDRETAEIAVKMATAALASKPLPPTKGTEV